MPEKDERRARFIGTFVNEMFAILLGIGMGSVVFRDDFSLTDVFRLASALLVVLVVILYWWEWVESIEEQVVTTKREFVIDLLMTFVFLLMFAYYDQPPHLAVLGVFLAFLDLFWVVNFCYESQLVKVVSGISVSRWIARKLGGLAIFAICSAILFFASSHMSCYFQLAIVFIAFAAYRLFCFGEAKRIPAVLMRVAQPTDISSIVAIHNSHHLEPGLPASAEGFMLGRVSQDLVSDHLSRRSCTYYVATSARGNVLGFVVVTSDLPPETWQVTWKTEESQEALKRGHQCHVLHIAVHSEATGKGVAQAMYANLYRLHDNAVFSAFVATKPVKNLRSLEFHQKQRFQSFGVFSRDEFFGLKDYESVLLVRLPQKSDQAE